MMSTIEADHISFHFLIPHTIEVRVMALISALIETNYKYTTFSYSQLTTHIVTEI